ncbi:MAG TPA: hypothetical protein VFI44_05330, partial [Ornithinibacter sp.]|nr:hypothetical protein [Ornithinibacter sp.]
MSSAAHRRGLSRLLLGAAFVLLGWLFLSATPAAADDTAAPVVAAVEEVVSPVVESESLPGAETVPEPLAAVVEPTTQVVEHSVATTVPTAVATTTEVVEATVEATPVAPVVSGPVAAVTEIVRDTTSTLTVDVVEPVVSGAGTVLGTA